MSHSSHERPRTRAESAPAARTNHASASLLAIVIGGLLSGGCATPWTISRMHADLEENLSTVAHPTEGERLSISPNPISTTLHVRLADPLLITITDLLGNTLRTYGERHGFIDIDVSDLANGTYMITASDHERVVAREKFIKY